MRRNSENRAIGSRRASASRSAGVLYSFSSSDRECEYGRITCACTNAGPLRARTYAAALPHGAKAGEEIGAVDRIDVQAGKRSNEAGDVAAGGLGLDRNRDRVAVVLDEEEHRQAPEAGGVERFPELALARGAVAERDVDDLVGLEARLAIRDRSVNAAVDHARFGGADRLQHLRAGRARLRDDVQIGMPPVRRHLPPVGARIVFGADAGEQHVERRDAELQAQRAIAIVRIEPVVARLQREAGRDEHGFVAGAADLKKDLALVLELDLLVVELSRQQHAAVDGEELLAGQVGAGDADTARLSRGGRLSGKTEWLAAPTLPVR